MRTARRAAAAGAALAAAVSLAACGVMGTLSDDDAGEQTATIGVLVPRSGWQQAEGAGVVAAVEQRIAELTDDIDGWVVDVVPIDEGDDAATAAEGAAQLVEDGGVAIIGGLTTRAVRAVQPVADDADVLFVSPADVVPAHTRGADPQHPLRPYESYYRTAVTDEAPETALARYARIGLDAKTAAVINGGDAAEAKRFDRAFRDDGGEVVVTGVADDENAVAQLVKQIRTDSADVVFVSGEPEVAGAVATAAARGALATDVLGTSAMRGDVFTDSAGSHGEGAVTALPPRLQPTAGMEPESVAQALETDAEADLGPSGAAAYDAATAVATVLQRCLPPASSAAAAREGCAGEMANVEFDGVTGEVAFDRFGDRVGGVVELRILRDGRWEALTAT